MSWFENLLGKKHETSQVSPGERREPVVDLPQVVETRDSVSDAATLQKEADERNIARILNEQQIKEGVPANETEHIDLPIKEIDARKAAYNQLVPYVAALKDLEQAAGGGTVTETTLNSSGFDQTLKETAATLKKTGRHPNNWTERDIQVDLVKLVREGRLPQLIHTYDTRLMEEKERIALLEGKQTIKNTRDAWRRMESNER